MLMDGERALQLTMKKEIAAVVFFLKRLIKKAEKLDVEKVDLFVERLTVALQEKFRGHWYPDNPNKGQAFRCIRVNRFLKEDPELLRACAESGVQYKDLGLPKELTLWVDPGEVCCRYGERNLAFTVASFSSEGDDDDKEDVTKKVTSAVERVTSDYHSGSSSDEDSGCRESCFTPSFTHNCPPYQFIYPGAPVWHPVSRKKLGPGKGHGPPRPNHFFHPPGRHSHSFKPNSWVPNSYRSKHGYWVNMPNMVHQH
ncbi:protein BTG3 isoform X2 [Astyanax mexicanus]|uniref:protein BTG3 isoform X2 n=1 Tax=Astyanax mexicanus TaxID=7994 RepID=UPI0020CB3CBB|nr:protein BTG3 isoform X2 [Astyanax mexicanus]